MPTTSTNFSPSKMSTSTRSPAFTATASSAFFDFDRHFAQELHRRQIVLAQMSLHRLGQPRFLHELNQADLRRVVSVAASASCAASPRTDPPAGRWPDAHRPSSSNSCVIPTFLPRIPVTFAISFLILLQARTLVIGSSLADSSLTADGYLCSLPNALISTSTPAGRSSFISASTVCCVGSRMSSSRLCVRISNCSRDFLSTCGERSTRVLVLHRRQRNRARDLRAGALAPCRRSRPSTDPECGSRTPSAGCEFFLFQSRFLSLTLPLLRRKNFARRADSLRPHI